MKEFIISHKGAKLMHPVYAPDLHPCRPNSPGKTFATMASWRESFFKFASFVKMSATQGLLVDGNYITPSVIQLI